MKKPLALSPEGPVRALVGAVRTHLGGAFPVDVVDGATSCWAEDHFFVPSFRSRRKDGQRVWDGKVHLYSPITRSLPTGAWPLAEAALRSTGVTPYTQFAPGAEPLAVTGLPLDTPMGGLRPFYYQAGAAYALLTAASVIGQRGSMRLPTGSGKTLTAAILYRELPYLTLHLVHGIELLDQTVRELKRFLGNDTVGFISADGWSSGRVLVGSVDTLSSRLANKDADVRAFLAQVVVVGVDECHRVSKSKRTFHKVLDRCQASRARVGFSGTPITHVQDADLLLVSRTGPLVYDVPPERLQKEGYLARAVLRVIEVTRPSAPDLNYPEAMRLLVAANAHRVGLVARTALGLCAEGRRTLVIAGNSRRHLLAIRDAWHALPGPHPAARFFTGSDSKEERKSALAALRSGELQLLASTVLHDEGIDVPDLDALVLAWPFKSFVKVCQRIGRVLRAKKHSAVVVDFCDMTNPYLQGLFMERLKVYDREKLFDSGTHEIGDLPGAPEVLDDNAADFEFGDLDGIEGAEPPE